jgi:hypothetical protein
MALDFFGFRAALSFVVLEEAFAAQKQQRIAEKTENAEGTEKGSERISTVIE